MAFIFDSLASNWVYLILTEFKFGSVAAQSCDAIKSTMAVYAVTWSYGPILCCVSANLGSLSRGVVIVQQKQYCLQICKRLIIKI